MSDESRSWIDRVLGYEELDPAARAEVDARLAQSPRLRELLAALREREAAARLRGALPPERDWDALVSGDADAGAEAASLRELHARASREAAGDPPALTVVPGRARTAWRRWLAPVAAAAAAAAVLLLWPRATLTPPPLPAPRALPAGARVSDFAIVRGAGLRGGDTSAWRTGDAFALRFRLSEPAAPVVFLLDERDSLARLHPADGDTFEIVAAGDVTLPRPGSGVRWSFEGPAGREAFLLVAAHTGTDLATLTAEAQRAVAAAPDRAAKLAALEAALRRSGDVSRLEAEHR